MISCAAIRKTFSPRRKHGAAKGPVEALRGVDLQVATGELHGLIGANGSGKSTLLRILATVVIPTSGSAAVDGNDVVTASLRVRRVIGVSSGEERSLYWRLTGRENLEFYAGLHRMRDPRAGIDHLMQQFDLGHAADRPVSGYSQGMLHRLGLARALLHHPKYLLLDEPTKSLDPVAREEFHQHLHHLRGQGTITILMATHDLVEASQFCDRVSVLKDGQISDICESPDQSQLAAALRAAS